MDVGVRRSWPERAVLVVGVALVAGCLYSAWFIRDIEETFSEIPSIAVSPGVLAEVGDPQFDPRNILVIGWTDTTGIDSADDIMHGRDQALVADTMMVVRIDPTAATAAVLSIPRDLTFDGYRKINESIAAGPENAVNRVKQSLDIEIHDFVLINFAGFREIVDSIDGVPVYFPHAARDEKSFFSATAGCHVLGGAQALNYVRSREYQQHIDGQWRYDNTYDYGRTERQRDFLVLAIDRVIAKGGRNPSTMRNLLKTTVDSKSIVLDARLTAGDLLDIGRSLSKFEPESLQRYALPTYPDANNLRVDATRAKSVLDVFRGNVPDLQPFQVPLRVIDARQSPSQPPPARQLGELGFVATSARATSTAAQTTVRFTSDERFAAILLARHLDRLPVFEQIQGSKATLLNGETLQLVVGDDWSGVRAQPRGDDESAELGRLADAAATGRASASTTTTTTASTAVAPTDGTGAAAGTAPVAPAGGIIGRPRDGVPCTRG